MIWNKMNECMNEYEWPEKKYWTTTTKKKIQTYEHIGNHQQTRIRSVCEKPEKWNFFFS